MTHEDYMRLALEEGRLALATGDVPVGCVIAGPDGSVIGRGRNRREADHSALAHAEVEAIRQACETLGSWRLHGCTMYVTLEPCPMCAGALINARVRHVYYGAKDEKAGSVESVTKLFDLPYNHRPTAHGGVLEAECGALLSEFFERLREQRKER